MPSLRNNLRELAESSLRANIIPTSQGTLCVAGAHQFKTLWTRDFCYAVPGLISIGADDVVRRQLKLILSFTRQDGLLPRGLDVTSPKVRVVNALVHNPLKEMLSYSQPLRAEYKGEHGTIAFDSNVLWLQAAQRVGLTELPADRLLSVYKRDSDGLYDQPKYSDWMDSQKRTGARLTFHVLMWQTRRDLGRDNDALLRVIRSRWFDERELWRGETTDALLMCIESGIGDEAALVAEIARRPVGVPSLPVAASDVSWTARAVGLRHYHDGFAWTWLAAETARVLNTWAPEFSERIFADLERLCEREGGVPEIYHADRMEAVRLPLYRAEKPFTWGAAKILEALAATEPITE